MALVALPGGEATLGVLSGALQVQHIFLCKVCWQLQISEASISYIETKLIENIGISI